MNELFRNEKYEFNGQTVDQTVIQLYKTQLQGKTKYSYCPYCVRELREKYPETLSPLFIVTYKIIQKTEGRTFNSIDKAFECDCCKRQMNIDTFSACYGNLALKEKNR